MRKQTRKSSKICLVCGKDFKGTAAAQSCGNACRVFLHRLLAAGKRPEFYLIAKSKGQKVPDISGASKILGKKNDDNNSENDVPAEMNWRLKQKLGIK